MSVVPTTQAGAIEAALIGGDLAKLNAAERVSYYKNVCDSLGLNELTKPFEYITLNGKLTLYARRDCTDQLRSSRNISITVVSRELQGDVFIVTARASMASGRQDESVGAVSVGGLRGDALANAYMKAETKAKRRVTLSICGLGMLDESEVATIQHEPAPPVRAVLPMNAEPATEPAPTESGAALVEAVAKKGGRKGKVPPEVVAVSSSVANGTPKERYASAVKAWSGMSGPDWGAACHTVAKAHGHADGAKGLTDDEYDALTKAVLNDRDNGVDFMAFVNGAAK